MQLTSPDPAVRQRTADYLVELARCCRDLGGDLMVFGSPAQRKIPAGASQQQAHDYAVDTFRRALPAIARRRRQALPGAAAPRRDGLHEHLRRGRRAAATASTTRIFCLHLDVKAMSSEATPVPELIRRHAARTGHFHANDPNQRGPGFGDTDFVPIFRALKESELRRLGVGRGVRLHARPRDDRPREHPLHEEVRGRVTRPGVRDQESGVRDFPYLAPDP